MTILKKVRNYLLVICHQHVYRLVVNRLFSFAKWSL